MTACLAASAVALAGGCGVTPSNLSLTVRGGAGEPRSIEAPRSVKGGLSRITLRNEGREPLDAQLVRVDGPRTAREVVRVVGARGKPMPGWIHGAGGVGSVPPGRTGTVIQNLPAGRYYVVAGQGARPGVAPLTITRGKPGELPKTEGVIAASEYRFRVGGLRAGKEQVLFRNAGRELHHVVAAPIAPRTPLADVKQALAAEISGKPLPGPPPVRMGEGFQTTVLDGGLSQVIQTDLKPGRYALMCFVSDRRGGPPHVLEGMLKAVVVR